MEKKQKKAPKSFRVTVRFEGKAGHKVRWLAQMYAGGNLARWIRHGALEAPRQHLKKD